MKSLRILLLTPDGNPDSFSSALVGYSHSEALARLHSVTLVTRPSNAAAICRKQHPFQVIEAIRSPWLDRIYAWCFRWIFKGVYASQALTAFNYPFCLDFEWRVWRLMRRRIKGGEFDIVLRLMPITAVLPSLLAYFLRRGPIPFVIGPINGGLPWPKDFSQAKKGREWISGLRNFYRFLPFARSTYRYALAIIAGSSQTFGEFSAYSEKLFFVPENGVTHALLDSARTNARYNGKLELIFVGGLFPIKGCDLAIRAAVKLLRGDLARFTIIGDGPERARLESLTKSLGIEDAVSFRGMLPHAEAMKCMREGDVFVFPSIRDFGAGVVFEALALGVVPIVVDFGGPGDIVSQDVGFKVALTNEGDIVSQIENILSELENNRTLLNKLRQQGMHYARETLSWDGKAQIVTKILYWVVGKGIKPDLPAPKKRLPVERVA